MKKYKTVCAIVVNDKNEILLIKRGREPYKDKWALISGIGESKKGIPPEIGVVEEVNCDLSTNSFKGKRLFSIPVSDDKFTDEIVVFVGKVDVREIRMRLGFSIDYKWVSEKNTKDFEDLAFEHTEIIQRYLKGKIQNS